MSLFLSLFFFIIYINISKLPLCHVCCIRVARQQHETGQHFKRSYINTQRLPAWPQLKRPPLITAGHQPNNYLQLAALIPTLTQTPHPTGALESSGGATGGNVGVGGVVEIKHTSVDTSFGGHRPLAPDSSPFALFYSFIYLFIPSHNIPIVPLCSRRRLIALTLRQNRVTSLPVQRKKGP